MDDPRRLHPASPVFNIIRQARALLVPGLAVLLLGGDSWQLWIMLLFIPSAAFEIARFFTFRYTLTDDRLVTTLTFLSRTERALRYERIQNIESVQNLLHRMLGVAEIRIETGAGGKPEAVLRVVPATEVARIRERVFADREPAADQASPSPTSPRPDNQPRILLRLTPLDYMQLGLITMRGMVLLAIITGLAWEFDLFDRITPDRAWVVNQLLTAGRHANDLTVPLAFAGMLLLAAAALVLASIAWAVLRFGGFRLTREGEDFRIQAGLLTRVHATVPRHHIQLVRLTQAFQHRRFRRAAISVETAGGVDAESNKDSSFGRKWFAPLIDPQAVPALASEIRPSLSLDAQDWSSLSPRAKRRQLRKGLIIAAAVAVITTAATFAFLGTWSLALAAAIAGLIIIQRIRAAALARYRHTDDWIGCRAGVATRHTSVAFLDRVQVIEVTQSPFDRRAGMSTLRVDTAGALSTGPRVELPMLDTDQAHDHARAVAQTAERSGFAW